MTNYSELTWEFDSIIVKGVDKDSFILVQKGSPILANYLYIISDIRLDEITSVSVTMPMGLFGRGYIIIRKDKDVLGSLKFKKSQADDAYIFAKQIQELGIECEIY